MSSPRIAYSARSDATPEAEIAALAAVYRLVVIESANRKGSNPDSEASGPNAHRDSHDRKAVPSGPSS